MFHLGWNVVCGMFTPRAVWVSVVCAKACGLAKAHGLSCHLRPCWCLWSRQPPSTCTQQTFIHPQRRITPRGSCSLLAGVQTGVTLWKTMLRSLQMLETELPHRPVPLFCGIYLKPKSYRRKASHGSDYCCLFITVRAGHHLAVYEQVSGPRKNGI